MIDDGKMPSTISEARQLSQVEKKLADSIDENEVIAYCKKLVSIPSIFGSEQRISAEIARDLEGFGLDVTTVSVPECGPSVVGIASSSFEKTEPPKLVFNGHMDTVQVCEGWTRDPFTPSLEEGKIYGLGSVDMKGGLAAMIMAAKSLTSSGLSLRNFAVHAVTDEECWSRGTTTLIDKGFYKGASECIVCEPSNLERLRNSRRAQCLINIIVTGKSTHGAQPENGVNAITEAAKVITAISKISEDMHPRIVDFKLNLLKSSTCVLKIEGGSDALSVPDRCVIRVDRHVLPGSTLADGFMSIKSYLEKNLDKETLGRVKIEFVSRPAPPYEAFETDSESRLVKTILAVAPSLGYDPKLNAGLSVADDCLIATRCHIPVVSYGPGGDITTNASGRAHESDEYVYARQVLDAARIYVVSAYRLLA
jgi:succinyl-diaminopimelate desuccinylase